MNKISPIKERILYFIEIKGLTKLDFCEKVGISYANMKGKSLESEIGGSQIAEILSTFDEISPDWLILGKGDLFRNKTSTSDNSTTKCQVCIEKERVIEALKSTISKQDTIIELLSRKSK